MGCLYIKGIEGDQLRFYSGQEKVAVVTRWPYQQGVCMQHSKLRSFWSPWQVEKIFGNKNSGKSNQLATNKLKEKLTWNIISNRTNLINSTSGGITCLSLSPSRRSETRLRKSALLSWLCLLGDLCVVYQPIFWNFAKGGPRENRQNEGRL